MGTGELLAALFWLAVACGVTLAGWNLGLGSLNDPGSGFMIFWIGAVMTVLALAAVVVAAWANAGGDGLASLWVGTRWYLVPYVTVLLALYAWLLPTLGFIVGSALLLFILFKTVEPQGWLASILGAAVMTAASYLVFHRWLGTQLPAGNLADRLAPWIF